QVRVERASARRLVEEPGHGTGSDLKALAAYLLRCKKKEREILGRQQELGRRIGHQLDCVLKARQNHHLLEKLRQRRLEQWTYESNRETERVASEAYLARWVRQ
ncbi:MAG: hypothetical protein HY013_11180, partial [Candidatus Solibacter usitatus]|nr:hypothetical protein [Candidatus Solibacter usitatus]